MHGQIGAVTGIRKKPSYTDIINAETPFLPRKVQAKEDREFQDQTYDFNAQMATWEKGQAERQHQFNVDKSAWQEQQGLDRLQFDQAQDTWNREQAAKTQAWEVESAHDARRQQNRANNMGYLNTGINIVSSMPWGLPKLGNDYH